MGSSTIKFLLVWALFAIWVLGTRAAAGEGAARHDAIRVLSLQCAYLRLLAPTLPST